MNELILAFWRHAEKHKHAYCFRMTDDRPFAFAGLWELWRPESGPPLLTCAILTTAANELVRPVHDRMPVIVESRHYDLWIDRTVQEPSELAEVLRPLPADAMRANAVSPWVNDARHDDARCLESAAQADPHRRGPAGSTYPRRPAWAASPLLYAASRAKANDEQDRAADPSAQHDASGARNPITNPAQMSAAASAENVLIP